MAIEINNTVVIDNSRNLTNIAAMSASGTVTASLFSGSGASLTNIATFPAGTRLLFQQTAAPTGWTKDTTHNDKALRIVNGTAANGGSVLFSTAFGNQAVNGTIGNTTATNQATTAGGTVGATTLTVTQIPAHSHPLFFSGGSIGGGVSNGGRTNQVNTENTGGGGSHTHSFTGTSHNHTQNAHNHTFTGTSINLAVQYVDVILASKN